MLNSDPSDDDEVAILPQEAKWRSRAVRYFSGGWSSILGVMPEFELRPFTSGEDEPVNPFLLTVMRLPTSRVEQPIPVGVVSQSYALAPHRGVANLCREGLIQAGFDPSELRYEVGLSELGEWMNFRIYLPKPYGYQDPRGLDLDLRLECFNSVEGSSRLLILFGWYRFICSNGLVIGETKIEIDERHGRGLDLASIPERIREALNEVDMDRHRMLTWQSSRVSTEDVAKWADEGLSSAWGKKAAARVYHICDSGRDVELVDPFASGSATEKPVRHLAPVPGSPERAANKYDVAQAMSFVATHRNNAEDVVTRQNEIPRLLHLLRAGA